MNKEKTAEELDYGNRVSAIRKAVEHLNQGCTVNYVVDGLREWYGITMDTSELKKLLLSSIYLTTAAAIFARLYIFKLFVIYVKTGVKSTNISKI